jgi:hypothetical protein
MVSGAKRSERNDPKRNALFEALTFSLTKYVLSEGKKVRAARLLIVTTIKNEGLPLLAWSPQAILQIGSEHTRRQSIVTIQHLDSSAGDAPPPTHQTHLRIIGESDILQIKTPEVNIPELGGGEVDLTHRWRRWSARQIPPVKEHVPHSAGETATRKCTLTESDPRNLSARKVAVLEDGLQQRNHSEISPGEVHPPPRVPEALMPGAQRRIS